jgi:serine/threonine protein kinase
MVDQNGRVVILDFGITGDAKKLAEGDLGIYGTVHYMAPEQALSEGVAPSADWYAFGVMLFQALTGRFPFEGSPNHVLMQKTMVKAPPPRQFNRNVPEALNQLCVGLLKIEPEERPSSSEILATLAFEEQTRAAKTEGQDSVFVGRREALGTLKQALSDVQNGRPVSVFVYGESGVGKSFLVREFLNGIGPSTRVFRGRCYERESLPYKALDAVIDQVAEYLQDLPPSVIEELLPPDASLLRRLFRVLDAVPSIAQLAPVEFEDSANRKMPLGIPPA